jgi:hypothetical protein
MRSVEHTVFVRIFHLRTENSQVAILANIEPQSGKTEWQFQQALFDIGGNPIWGYITRKSSVFFAHDMATHSWVTAQVGVVEIRCCGNMTRMSGDFVGSVCSKSDSMKHNFRLSSGVSRPSQLDMRLQCCEKAIEIRQLQSRGCVRVASDLFH